MRKRNYIKTEQSSHAVRGKKLFMVVVVVLMVIYFLATRLLGDMGVVKYYRMKAQYSTLTEEIAGLKADNVKLRKDVRSLMNDPAYVERIARDKLGLARQGEIVYYYGEP